MQLTPNRIRLIVIVVLFSIAGGVILLLSLGGREKTGEILPLFSDTTTMRSFSSEEIEGPTASTDPCDLVGRGDVEAELGMDVAESQSGYAENPLGERFCRFPDQANGNLDLVHISIVFNQTIDPALLNDGFSVKRMYEGRKVDPNLIQIIGDLGDDAFWGGTGSELWNGLHILVHDIYVQINVASGEENVDYRAARNLAVIALERIFRP